MNYYQLLQVNREAHQTIIRYAYRFLAAMYHPDNSETGDAEKFRIVTEAWRTLSDEGKRAAYDMSLTAEEAAQPRHPGSGGPGAPGGPMNKAASFNREALKKNRTGVSWNEIELRLAILQILLDARKKRPKTGGASAKMIMDILDLNDIAETEYALWYLRESGFLEMGERLFMITVKGVNYIVDQLNSPTLMNESETEKKVRKVVEGGVPAIIPRDGNN
jgi:curved DNA-binding protein CbpA